MRVLTALAFYYIGSRKCILFENIPRLAVVVGNVPHAPVLQPFNSSSHIFCIDNCREGSRARDFEEAIEWLVSAGMLNRVYNVSKMEHSLYLARKTKKLL